MTMREIDIQTDLAKAQAELAHAREFARSNAEVLRVLQASLAELVPHVADSGVDALARVASCLDAIIESNQIASETP